MSFLVQFKKYTAEFIDKQFDIQAINDMTDYLEIFDTITWSKKLHNFTKITVTVLGAPGGPGGTP